MSFLLFSMNGVFKDAKSKQFSDELATRSDERQTKS
jgi:hypothetical protein